VPLPELQAFDMEMVRYDVLLPVLRISWIIAGLRCMQPLHAPRRGPRLPSLAAVPTAVALRRYTVRCAGLRSPCRGLPAATAPQIASCVCI